MWNIDLRVMIGMLNVRKVNSQALFGLTLLTTGVCWACPTCWCSWNPGKSLGKRSSVVLKHIKQSSCTHSRLERVYMNTDSMHPLCGWIQDYLFYPVLPTNTKCNLFYSCESCTSLWSTWHFVFNIIMKTRCISQTHFPFCFLKSLWPLKLQENRLLISSAEKISDMYFSEHILN